MVAYQTRTVAGRTQVKRANNAWYYVDETTGLPELKWDGAYWEVKRQHGGLKLSLMQPRKKWWGGVRVKEIDWSPMAEDDGRDHIIWKCLYVLARLDGSAAKFIGKYPPKNINEVEEK